MASILVQLDASYSEFLEPNGSNVVQLDKALYGCVEAALLWYKDLRGTLDENPHDRCVFNKTDPATGVQLTVALHVDDLLVTCASEEMLQALDAHLKSVYHETKTNRGHVVNYVDMSFDFSGVGSVGVTMDHCTQDILASCTKPPNVRSTQAADTPFDVRLEAEKATEAKRQRFHSLVAKTLYLAKRDRCVFSGDTRPRLR